MAQRLLHNSDNVIKGVISMRKFVVAVLCILSALALTGGVVFAEESWQMIPEPNSYSVITTDWWSVPSLVDIDADGDLDMFLGNGRTITQYRNDGTAQSASWTWITDDYAGVYISNDCVVPNFQDIDADGDYDLLISACGGNVYYYRNDGTPQSASWTLVTSNLVTVPLTGCSHVLTFADMDADNDLDMFLDSCDWIAHYFENQGSATNPNFVMTVYDYVYDAVGLQWYGDYIALKDFDADGDLDMLASDTSGYLAHLRNIGSASSPSWELVTTAFPNIMVNRSNYGYIFPQFVDMDADGNDEVVMGDEAGYLTYYENEVKHDSIDQDGNGLDLTLDITKAEYKQSNQTLTIEATSDLGGSANLQAEVDGVPYTMTFKGNRWSATVSPVTPAPYLVRVSGDEGSETLEITIR
jgi:hypothetical protein